MKKLITICLVAVLILAGSNAFAFTWIEIGDAGELLGTAQVVSGGGLLTEISGTLSEDADMYQIHIGDPFGFSAAGTGISDSQLFLFDSSGMGVYTNDDFSGLDPFLPAGHTYSPTTPGCYYLAISPFNYDPYDSSNVDIFGAGLGTLPPVAGAGAVDYWDGSTSSGGGYRISLTGATADLCPIPAPGAIFLGSIGVSLVGWLRRRRTL